MDRAAQCALDHGGVPDVDWRTNPDAHLKGAVGAWRDAFIKMPYNREVLTPRNIISDTFESAITWDRFESFYHAVRATTRDAICEATGQDGVPYHAGSATRIRTVRPPTSLSTVPDARAPCSNSGAISSGPSPTQ